MPYIKQCQKEQIKPELDVLLKATRQFPESQICGVLNYIIFSLINDQVKRFLISYNLLNKCIGVLECCKQEFYRRVAAPYEDIKIKDNGDVL